MPVDWSSIGVYGAGKGLEALFGALGGDPDEQYRKLLERFKQLQIQQRTQGFNQIQGDLNNPDAYKNRLMRSLAPQFNQIASNASQRAGLDSGNAQGEIARSQQGAMAGGMLDRNNKLLQMLSQYR